MKDNCSEVVEYWKKMYRKMSSLNDDLYTRIEELELYAKAAEGELSMQADSIEELEAELKQQRLLVYSATGGCSYQRLAKALERVREMEKDDE